MIGEDSLIGAGAVVTEGARIPPGSVVLGVPGRVVKETTEEQRAQSGGTRPRTLGLAGRYR